MQPLIGVQLTVHLREIKIYSLNTRTLLGVMKWLGYPTLLAHNRSQGSGASSSSRNQARWIMALRSGPVPMYLICEGLSNCGLAQYVRLRTLTPTNFSMYC